MDKAIVKDKGIFKTSSLIKISLLSVIGFLLMLIEFPLPLFPEFLKLDLSDIPAIVGGFALGPVAGVMIELIKNILKFVIKTGTGGVGEFANFIVGGAFVFVSAGIYHMKKDKKHAIIGCIVASIVMALVGGLANNYILLPFYTKFMPMDAIIGMAAAVNKLVVSKETLVLYAIVPFNLIKGIILSVITAGIYKKVSPLLKNR